MSKSQWQNRAYSKQKWREVGDGSNRMRYEKSHPWHFTGEGRDAAAREAYAANYGLIDWADDGEDTQPGEGGGCLDGGESTDGAGNGTP